MYVYEPLRRRLEGERSPRLRLTYSEMERLIGRSLPPSARGPNRRQWWANTGSHSQARAWLSSGRRARPLGPELVEFYKSSESSLADESAPGVVTVQLHRLRPATQRAIADLAEEAGVSSDEAAAALLDRYALEQRAARLAWFQASTKASTTSSAELIRSDRDGR